MDELDDFLNRRAAEKAQQATNNIALQQRVAEKVARAQLTAQALGIPSTKLVEDDPEVYAMARKKQETDTFLQNNPWAVGHFIENVDAAAMVQPDDLSKLGNISAAFGMKPSAPAPTFGQRPDLGKLFSDVSGTPAPTAAPPSRIKGFRDLMLSSAKRLLVLTNPALAATADNPAAAVQQVSDDITASGVTVPQYVGRFAKAAPSQFGLSIMETAHGILGVAEIGTSLLSAPFGNDPLFAYYRQQDAIAEATQKLYKPSWATTDFQLGTLSGMQSLAQMVSLGPLGEGRILAGLGAIAAGQAESQFRDRGAGAVSSAAGAITTGLLEAGTEKIGIGGFLSRGGLRHAGVRGAMELLIGEPLGEQVATATQDFVDYLVPGSQFKTFKEYLDARPAAAVQTLAASLTMAGAVGALTGARHAFVRTARNQEDAVEGLHGQAILDEIMKNAADAPLRKLSPAEFAKTVDAAAAESPVRHVFIPVEAIDKVLADETISDDEKAVLTVYQDQIEEARVNNGDVVIPIGAAAAQFSGTKIWEAVRDDARVLAGGISGREAREKMDSLIDELEKVGEQAVDEAKAEQPRTEAKQKVYEEVKAQVLAAGRSEREAQTTGVLLASRAENLASERYGQFKDASEAWEWMKLRVQGQAVKGGKKVAQAEQAVVNIGLDVNDGSKLTPEQAVQALRDQGVQVTAQEVRQSGTEPTLVATLDKPLTPEQAHAVSTALKQDAIAQRVGATGELYGPAAEKWGPFNPDFFLSPSEITPEAGWTDERVDQLIGVYGYLDGTSKAFAVMMSPDEFLGLTASETGRRLIEERVEGMPEEYGTSLDLDILRASMPPTLLIGLAREPSDSQKAMGVDRLRDQVMGHEGRHRAMLMKKAGIEQFPVVIHVQKVNAGDKATGPRVLDFNPQRSRSDQVSTGDQPVIGREAIPISWKYREQLMGLGGQTLFQSAAIGGYEGLSQHLTDEEKAGLREVSKQKILAIAESLPDAEEMAAVALAGRAKRGWYENSAQAILDVFGAADAPRFAALLAALSPQTSVESNLFNALMTWTNWNNAGRPTDRQKVVRIMGDSVQGGRGVGSLLNSWINNAVTALTAENPAQIKLSGPKVDSFMNNLVGVIDEVTNDTWMANYSNVDPVLFRKIGQNKGPGYKAMNAVVRKAADILTERTGESWSPAEVQETVWSLAKTVYEMRDVAGETRSMQQLLEAGHVTHDDIANTPDFGVLFSDGIYQTILEAGGYETGSLGRNRRAVGVNGQESVAEAPEGSGFSQDDFRRFLAQAAHRLEIVRQRRRGTVAEDQFGFPFEEGLASQENGALEPLTLQQFGGEVAAASSPELMNQLELAKRWNKIFSAEEIWEKTGWTKGAEGKWRFEIPDSNARLNRRPSPEPINHRGGVQPLWLKNVLEHPQLYYWYPELKHFTVIADPTLEADQGGYFDFTKNMIGFNPKIEDDQRVLSVILHEVQHAIQEIEGFARGGPMAEAGLRAMGLGDQIDQTLELYRAINRGEVAGWNFKTVRTDEQLRFAAVYRIYDNLAGEIEARNVQERMNLQPDLLAIVHPDLDPQLGMHEYPLADRIVFLPEDIQEGLAASVDGPIPELPVRVQQTTPPPRGETTFYPNGQTIVTLFGRADFSTMLHELSHVFLQQEFELAQADGASKELKADIAALTKWFEANGGAVENGMPNVAAHELFARTGERYFREGKAPSAELRAAFKQFREWLTGIYKNVRDLLSHGPAPINPEIREIMDRMIATDEAIRYNSTQPMSREELGMTEAEYQAYLDSFDEAIDRAHDTLLEKMMTAIRRRNDKAMREQRENIKEEVRQRVNAEPRFIALHLLRTGRWLGDPERERTPIKINTGWLIDNYGEEILKQLPVGLQPLHRGDGVPGDEIAQMTGMASGDALVKALVAIKADADARKAEGDGQPLRDKLVEEETDRIMAERHGDIAQSEAEIEEEAIAALNSNRQGEILATELRQLRKKGKVGGPITPYQILREWARRKANDGLVKDVISKSTLARYTRLINKARNAFETAILKGDNEEAIKQKQAQLINHALFAEGKKVADEIGIIVRRMQRYANTKALASIDQDYMDRIHELLEGYDFRTVSEARLAEKTSFEEWAQRQRDQGAEVYVPPRFRDNRTNWREAQVSKLLELNDMVQSLVHLGKLKQQMIVAGEQRRLEELRDEAEASVLALPERKTGETSVNEITKPLRQRIREAKTFGEYAAAIGELFRPGVRVRQMATGLVKIEGVADILDQTKMGTGPFNRMLIRGATNAINEYTRIKEEVMDVISDAYHSMSGKMAARLNDHVTIPELILNAGLHPDDPRRGKPLSITRKQLLALVANTGNLSNLSKLGVGEGWVEDGESMVELTRLQQILINHISKEEMDLVQALWDGMGKLWPHIVRVERQLTGVVPEAVVPMEVQTPWGPYTGGYWPVVWDSDRTDMGKPDEETSEANLFGVGSGLSTFKGHTITRTGAAAPMDWSLDRVLFSRTNQIISRIAYAPWIRDTLKLLNTPRVSGAIKLRLGNEYFGAIKNWMRDQIPSNSTSIQGAKFWENLLTSMRVNMTATVLGISYTTGIAQTLGLTYSAGVLGEGNIAAGPKWLAAGFKEMLRLQMPGQPGAQEFVFGRSEEMRRRAHELNREVQEVFSRLGAQNLNVAQRVQRKIQATAFWHIAFIDLNTVSIPTWLGGYQKAKAQGLSEEDAAAFADKMVRLSQGTGREKDMSAIQRGNAGQRFISMFYTPSSVFFNAQWESAQHMKAGNWSKALAPTFWFLVANTLADAYRSGDWPPEDEDGNIDLESVSKWVARNLLFGLFYGVPVARDIANTANRKIRGQYADWGTTPLSYGLQAIGKAGAAVSKAFDDEKDVAGSDIKAIATATGWLLGLPGAQVGRTGGFLYDVQTGKEQPEGIGDWFKGLTSGKTSQSDKEKTKKDGSYL